MEEIIKHEKNQLSQRQHQSLSIGSVAIIESEKFPKIINQTDLQIKQLLVFIFSIIGITGSNLPDEYQEKILISYIRNHLSKSTTQDFKIAFMLGLKSKLDFNVQSFQNFNPLYLENVMQSFNRYKFNIIKENREKLKQKETEISQVDKEKLNNEAIKKFITIIYNGENCIDSVYVIVYNFLKKSGQLNLSDKEKLRITQEAEIIQEKLTEQLRTKYMSNGDLIKARHMKSVDLVVIQKKIATKEYLENCKELEIKINEIITVLRY